MYLEGIVVHLGMVHVKLGRNTMRKLDYTDYLVLRPLQLGRKIPSSLWKN